MGMEMKNMGSPVKVGKMDATSFSSKYGLVRGNFMTDFVLNLFLIFFISHSCVLCHSKCTQTVFGEQFPDLFLSKSDNML